jgi:crotonobetainyl-CoA:carnitine CoA-transferase CaiB-like acyl-CoA transferase
VPCGPIYSIDQVFADEQVKHLDMAQDVPSAKGRDLRLVAQPIKLSRTPSVMAARQPVFGEHSDEILVEFGFGEDEIAELKQQKVV